MVFDSIQYKRPLVVGTGGGNDIVSATLILSGLLDLGKNPDLAGVCSPAAWHTYNGGEEEPINLVTAQTKRYRPSKVRKEISFIDAKIPDLLKVEGINSEVYHLSFRYGTSELVDKLKKLILAKGYDGIVAVDVGGDILARGKQDPTILSPLMDFSTLYVLSQLETPSTLVEFGLQTDGELRPKGCEEILEELNASGALTSTEVIKQSDKAVSLFERVYRGIENIRHWHTAHMTLQTLASQDDVHTEYRARIRVLDKKWQRTFPITLESKYFGKAFLIDLKKLARTRPLAFSYESPLELYLKTKRIVDTKTEMDMLYAWSGDSCLWLGLLCPQVQGDQRKEILSYGLNNLKEHADVAVLWRKDSDTIPSKFYRKEIDQFVVAGESSVKVSDSVSAIETALGGKYEK